jgi:hypothetical protein
VVLHLRARVPDVRQVSLYVGGVCGSHIVDCGMIANACSRH